MNQQLPSIGLKLFFVFIFSIATFFCFSQDVIILRNGDEIKSKVLEVSSAQIKYKKYDNLDGPTYSAEKSDVFMIKYKNGTKDVFEATTKSNNSSSASPDDLKKTEALKKVEAYIRNEMNQQVTNLVRIAKTNGVSNTVFGQNVYTLLFEVDLELISDGWLKGNDLEGYWRNSFYVYGQQPDLSAAGQTYMYGIKMLPKGTLMTLGGEAVFANADNGYELKKVNIKTQQNKGNAERKRVKSFIDTEFTSGIPKVQVLDYLGEEINSAGSNTNSYHISSLGESKFITIKRTWQFKSLPRQTSFIIKYNIQDRDPNPQYREKSDITIAKRDVILEAGSNSYSLSIKIPISNIRLKQFDISEDYFFADNTSMSISGISKGPFELESNFNIKINTIYSKADLEALSNCIDTNAIENVEKSYYLQEFYKKSFLCKEGIRFRQWESDENILTGVRETCDNPGNQAKYMYFKGIVFDNSLEKGLLLLYKKTEEGVDEILYDAIKKQEVSKTSLKKKKSK